MNAKLIKFEIKEMPVLCVVGKQITAKMSEIETNNPIPAFWKECFKENMFENIRTELKEYIYDPSFVGFMQMTSPGEFIYICGILMKPGCPVSQGCILHNIDSYTAGIGWIQGKEPDIYMLEHTATEKAANEAGFEYDSKLDFSIEFYNCSRYNEPNSTGDVIIDYYIPVKKKI